MRCPECGGKIKATDYDPVFEWYECPSCEGAITADEILEAELLTRRNTSTRRTEISNGKPSKKAVKKAVAKAKKKKAEIAEDDEAIAEFEKKQMEVQKGEHYSKPQHRDETPTKAVVNIMADEIQAIYEMMGEEIDRVNAMDKALIIWRDVRYNTQTMAREREVPHVLCPEHS